jgi:hypothetical protein
MNGGKEKVKFLSLSIVQHQETASGQSNPNYFQLGPALSLASPVP